MRRSSCDLISDLCENHKLIRRVFSHRDFTDGRAADGVGRVRGRGLRLPPCPPAPRTRSQRAARHRLRSRRRSGSSRVRSPCPGSGRSQNPTPGTLLPVLPGDPGETHSLWLPLWVEEVPRRKARTHAPDNLTPRGMHTRSFEQTCPRGTCGDRGRGEWARIRPEPQSPATAFAETFANEHRERGRACAGPQPP